MEATDWATSSVVFIVAVSTALVMSAHLVSQDAREVSESQLQDIIESVSDEINIQSMILKHDCDPSLYDCNREYPVEVNIKRSKYNMLSRSFTQDENKLYSVMPLGSVSKLYSMPRQKISPNYPDAQTLSISTDENIDVQNDVNNIIVSNDHLSASINDSNATVDFLDSLQQDLVVSYPRMYMAKLKDSNSGVVVGNDANEFYLRFFPNSAEFWIDTPDDLNVRINPVHQNWKKDQNIGVFNRDKWWDADTSDAYWWNYRIPVVMHSQDTARYDLNVKTDINFLLQKQRLGMPNALLDPNSFRLVEYSDGAAYDSVTSTSSDSLALENQPFEIAFNSNTEMAAVEWTVLGTTPANSHRVYYLYFDFYETASGNLKPTYSETTINYVPPEPPVYLTVAFPQQRAQTSSFDTNRLSIFNPNTLLLNTVNQLSRVWQYNAVSYRKPLLFDSGLVDREQLTVSADINFARELELLGLQGQDLNLESLSLVRVNNWDEGTVIEELILSDENIAQTFDFVYNSTTKSMELSWVVPATPAKTKRYYFLYFDVGGANPSAPTTTDNSDNEWHSTDVTITLSPTDNSGTGIAATYYCTGTDISCTPETAYSAGITVTCPIGESCTKYVRYYSVDGAGNTETTKTSKAIKIDKVPPLTTDNAAAEVHYSDFTVSLTAADSGSGVAQTYYCVSDSSCTPATAGTSVDVTCPTGSLCTKYVNYYSTDSAGNPETAKSSVTITIDKSSNDWDLSGWNYRKKITFDNSAQSIDLTNFPALVVLNAGNFVYSNASSTGADLRFVDENGSTLYHEIESWNPNGNSFVWVKVPQINAQSPTDYVYLYYGNANATAPGNASSAWDSFSSMVHHFDAESGNTLPDSTSNSNNGTILGASYSSTGKIGPAYQFDGLDDYIAVENSSSLDSLSSLSIEAWVKVSPSGEQMAILERGNTGTAGSYSLGVFYDGRAFFKLNASGALESLYGNTLIDDSQWHYIAAVWTGSEAKIFVDGYLDASVAYAGTMETSSSDLQIGKGFNSTYLFHGSIDELRVSSVARLPGRIHANYLAQSNQFASVGSAESAP